jgi:NADH:ubiquinone oxidoreductase subunit K
VNLSVALPLVGAALFALGIFGVLARRNVLAVLMSIELLYNAAMLNFVAFNRYRYPDAAWGQGVALFILAIAAAEAVVGLALVLVVYRRFNTVLAEKLDLLKG